MAALVALIFKEPFGDLKEQVLCSQFDASADSNYEMYSRPYLHQRSKKHFHLQEVSCNVKGVKFIY